MSGEQRSLPVESLLPFPGATFPQPGRSTQSLEALQDALQQARREADAESQPEEDGSDGEKPAKRPKRARACIACRNMKIRCLPVDGKEACLACSKVNRDCVMPGPARKRQKTVHKVAELEKKINALTEALIAKNGPTPPTDSPANDRMTESQSDLTRSEIDPRSPEKGMESFNRYDRMLVDKTPSSAAKIDVMDWGCSRFSRREVHEPAYIDPIDRGLMELDMAIAMFNHFIDKMLPYFPVLAIPSYVKAQDMRAAKPTLFLAIIAVASSAVRPDMQSDLLVEINRQLSERILFSGEKSIELVQAILVYTTYYTRSKFAKDLAFNQYIHAAIVMCLDLGMGKRYRGQGKDGLEEAETRRTWLGCYYFASSVSTLLRHPSLVRWSPYVEECLQFFTKSPHALPSDAWLCAIVKGQHIAEEVCVIFGMDDPSSTISFGATKTQYHLKAFEKQLADWKAAAPTFMDRRLVEHFAASLNLYTHEIAIHHDHNVDDFRPDPDRQSKPPDSASFITTVHIDALTTCLDSCHRVIDSYLALEIEIARCIPNLFIVWNTYAAVGLIKLQGVLHAPDSTFGSIFSPNIRVEEYLSNLVNRLSEISAGGHWPPAEAFIFVTKKLISWHLHKKAPWLGEDGNTQQPNTQQAAASGLSYRTPEENKAQDRATTSMMRGFERSVGLPENFGPRASSSQVQDSNAITAGINQGYDVMSALHRRPQTPMQPYDFGAVGSQTSDLNAAFNAANYNINWDELNFSQQELNVFDEYMNDQGWMGYLI